MKKTDCITTGVGPNIVLCLQNRISIAVVLTFIVESVDPVNTGALVVSAKQEEVFGVLDLVGQQKTNRLQALLASVHVVTLKE